jgi:hypothetical protein
MIRTRFLFTNLALILLAGCGTKGAGGSTAGSDSNAVPAAMPAPIPNILTVNPKMELGPISPYVYGSNYGPWTAVPFGKMEEALDSHVTAIRWPGGNWGDRNDIQLRQLDSFITLCKQIGAIPTLSVRLMDGTPEAAAQLVRYANIEKGYQIRYWSIGNEPDLYAKRPAVEYDTQRFNREWRAIAVAMKAVDPTIMLMGPELSGGYSSNFAKNPKDASGRDWMSEFLKINGDLIDIVTYHRYPFPVNSTGEGYSVDDLRKDLPEWTRTVRYLRGLIRETTGRDLPIAVTEASSDSSSAIRGAGTPDSFYHAIWWADALGRLIDENVVMVNQWDFTTASAEQGGWGLIAISGVRLTYYVYQMYHQFGTERIYAASGLADVSISAAKRPDGTLTIMVINLADSEQRVPIQVQGLKLSKAEVWLFDASHNAENLGEQRLPADGMLNLPAQSISLYAVLK